MSYYCSIFIMKCCVSELSIGVDRLLGDESCQRAVIRSFQTTTVVQSQCRLRNAASKVGIKRFPSSEIPLAFLMRNHDFRNTKLMHCIMQSSYHCNNSHYSISHNEELHNLHSSLSIIRIIKSQPKSSGDYWRFV
jgi:hypothetical protein